MSRRTLIGQAKPDVPRWRRGQEQPATGQASNGWTHMSKRHARQVGREMGAGMAERLTGTPLAGGAAPGTAPAGTAVAGRPRWQPRPTGLLATGKPHRARYQAAPFLALALIAGEGAAAHWLTHRHAAYGAAAALVTAGLLWWFTGHLTVFARRYAAGMAALTAMLVPAVAVLGFPRWLCAAAAAVWALVILRPWIRHYAWHPGTVPAAAAIDTTDLAIWARLAAARHWSAWLGGPVQIPGGVRYPITCDGTETDIGEITGQPRKIASAYGRSTTEAYAERHETGAEHRGWLTLLRHATLQDTAYWDGSGFDPVTGLARAGRFADAAPGHIRLLERMDGTRHGLLAGSPGSGKTEALELLIRTALATTVFPVIPVVLDAQEGQSLPEWRDHLIYASGPDECIETLRWLHTGMRDRSRELSRLDWADETGHIHHGMGFYDPDLARMPSLTAFTGEPATEEILSVILVIGDEFPVLLTHPKYGDEAVQLTGEMGKLGRKTGFAFWAVAQIPSLSELGDQVVRAMLRSGTVLCLRTDDSVSGGMLGLPADPSELAKKFPNEQPTYGLGYLIGQDGRQAEFRTDLTPAHVKRTHPDAPPLDSRLAAIRAGWRRDLRTGLLVPPPPPDAPKLAAVPDAPPAATGGKDDGPAGRTADDCILAVLRAAWPDALSRGELLKRCAALATSKDWGRVEPFSVRGITDRLPKLTTAGRVDRLDGGDGYRYARPAGEATGPGTGTAGS